MREWFRAHAFPNPCTTFKERFLEFHNMAFLIKSVKKNLYQVHVIFQLKQPVFCCVDEKRLHGYLNACRGVVQGLAPPARAPSPQEQPPSLLQRVEESRKNGFQVSLC